AGSRLRLKPWQWWVRLLRRFFCWDGKVSPMSDAGENRPKSSVREERLDEIRRQASERGSLQQPGVRAIGSPLPKASPQTGYYQQPLLKQPQWTPLVPLYFF